MDLKNLSIEQKRALLQQLLQQQDASASFPLSQGQRSLWVIHQLAPDSPAYNFVFAGRLQGEIDAAALERAFEALVDRHASLRTTYESTAAGARQRIHPQLESKVRHVDAAEWSWERMLEEIRQEADRPFDLRRGPTVRVTLYRQSPDEHMIVLTAHHIVADLWSMEVLIQELALLYRSELGLNGFQLPPVASTFADYVKWEEQLLASPRGDQLWQYWSRQLSGSLPVLDLPLDHPRPAVQTFRGESHSWTLDDEVAAGLKQIAQEHQATTFMTLLAAFQALLARYTGQHDILVGTTTATRGRPQWERVVGYYLNQLVIRSDVSDDPEFGAHLSRVRQTVLDALEHQDYPFARLVEKLRPARDAGRTPLFQVAFIWDKVNALAGGGDSGGLAQLGGAQLEPVLLEQRGAPFDLTLIVFEMDGELKPCLRYNVDLFEPDTIRRMAGHFTSLLRSVAHDARIRISDIPLLSQEEQQLVLHRWNDSHHPWPDERTVPEVFQERARQHPRALAVEGDDQQLTYAELDERAEQLARHLRGFGVGRGSLVGLFMPRTADAIAAMLAAWKAEAAYLPLDPSYPAQRLKFMVDDARPKVVVSHSSCAEQLPDSPAAVLLVDKLSAAPAAEQQGELDGDAAAAVHPDDVAYVIYTSGSTGQPKGVLVKHRGMVNTARAVVYTLGLQKGDRMLQFSSICFDASVWECTSALLAGVTLVLPPCGAALSGVVLRDLLREKQINILTVPPSILATVPAGELPALHTVVSAGEACTGELVSRWAQGRCFYNAYGPTEVSVCATIQLVSPDETSPSIGRPFPNAKVYLLNESMRPAPPGVAGELCVGGPGLAAGYLNRPELTAQRFVPNPFDDDGSALYRTGDLARHRPNGEIEFLGRIDNQVKVRGFRIELGEIEAALGRHPHVEQAVVAAQADPQGSGQRLVAYVVAANGQQPSTTDLRNDLKQLLPEYMIPAAFVLLPELPVSPSGKVDRRALPAVQDERPELAHDFVAPRNALERQLAELWQEVLGLRQVGVHDNFFDLGGASIQAVQVAELAADKGRPFPAEAIFQFQTIAELAEAAGQFAESAATAAAAAVTPAKTSPKSSTSSPSATPTSKAASQPRAATSSQDQVAHRHSMIESLGIYLPPRVVGSEDVVGSCRQRLEFPLERMTGIKHRRMAGDGEYSIDLARQAVHRCLRHSRYTPRHIDLLICCNISRYDGAEHLISFEPSTAMRLKQEFGFGNAVAFDISNACAGFFTAIKIADTLLKTGACQRALLVSGEYVTHLTRTAQQEIKDFLDPRLACLTLGDSGAAVILQSAPDERVGFHALDLYTLGKYHPLCVAKVTDQPHGGAIMLTDPVKASAVSIQQAVQHAQSTLQQAKWTPDQVQYLIMHQTSETTLDGAMHELNRVYDREVANRGNTVFNVAERGNTATTTHLVAVGDLIQSGRLQPGGNVAFAITGSGQTVGTALYTFDDLPERLRGDAAAKLPAPRPQRKAWQDAPTGVVIESIGSALRSGAVNDTNLLLQEAGLACLNDSSIAREEVELLLHAGIYRTDFVCEPSLASIAAGELGINSDPETCGSRRTLAFDVMNGAVGLLDACHIAQQFMLADQLRVALIMASEVENNTAASDRIHVAEAGSAMVLQRTGTAAGFGKFFFRSFPEHLDCLHSHTAWQNGRVHLRRHQAAQLHETLVDCLRQAVREFLDGCGRSLDEYRVIIAPQFSTKFLARLAQALDVGSERLVDATSAGGDLMTNSLPLAMAEVRRHKLADDGDQALILGVGSGVETACVSYWF